MRGNGRVFLRGRVWWIAYSHRGQEYRESSQSDKKAAAQALLRTRLSALEQGLPAYGATRRHTVGAVLDRLHAEYLRRGGRGPMQYAAHLKPLQRHFGAVRVVDLTETAIERFVTQEQRRRKANATINKQLGILGRALRLAQREGIIVRLPHLARLPGGRVREGFWEPQELSRMLEALPEWLKDVALFGYLTGWRRGEVLALQWRYVDLEDQTLTLRPEQTKTGRGRLLAVEGPLRELLRRCETARRPCPWVFHRDGRRIAPSTFRSAWTRACLTSGNVGKLFHDFRRTAVRNMVRAGVPERIAMEVSGHRSRSVFDRYNIVNEADIRQAMQQTYAYLEMKEKTIVFPWPGRTVGHQDRQGRR